MKRVFSFTLIFLFLITGINQAYSQNDKNDALYHKIIKEYTLHEDGSYDLRYYKELEILTYYAFHRLHGETFVIYDPDHQKLKVNESYTIMADGKKVETPINAYNEVLPRFASHAPPFNHLREMVITHPGMERNATIYLDYTLSTSKDFSPAFMGKEVLQKDSPVREMEIIVRVPEDMHLKYMAYYMRTSPMESEEDGMKVYKWKLSNLKAHSPEGHQVESSTPVLYFSAGKDLQRVYFSFVNQDAFKFQTDGKMEKRVQKAVEGKSNDLLKMLAIQKIVVDEVNTWNVPLKYAGFKCRPPAEVWSSNGGTEMEKAALLTALLLKEGIRAVPVAVIPKIQSERKLGNLMNFEKILIQVNTKESGLLYISPLHKHSYNLKYDLPTKTLLIIDGAIESLRNVEVLPFESRITLSADFVIEDTSRLTGNLSLELKDHANHFFDLVQDSAKAKKLLKGGFSSKDIKSFEINHLNGDKSKIDYNISKEKPFEMYSNLLFWNLPYASSGSASWGINWLADERNTNLELPFPIYERYEYTLTMPDNITPVTEDLNISIHNNVGKIHISLKSSKGKLTVIREIEFENQIIPVNHYTEFRELYNTWLNRNYQKIILKLE